MGLRDKIQAKVGKAFDLQLADAVQAFTGSREVDGGYDPVTGTVTGGTETYEGRGVFGSFKAEELTQHIEATDAKLTALRNEVTDTPALDDEIEQGGIRYTVKAVMSDPAAATWTLALRRT